MLQPLLLLLLLLTSVVEGQTGQCCSQQPYILNAVQKIADGISGSNVTINANLDSVNYYLSWLSIQIPKYESVGTANFAPTRFFGPDLYYKQQFRPRIE